MTVPIEVLVQTFPVWIESDFTPRPHGPRSSYSGSRHCDRPPYTPTFGALVDEIRHTRDGREVTHDAVDIGAAYGAAVVATCPGRVFPMWHYPNGEPGSADNPVDRPGAGVLRPVAGYVRVRGPEGYVIYYAHMSPVYVQPGQAVRTGDLLGRVYHAGNRGGPAHLHYQIRGPYPPIPSNGGRVVDPYPRLRELLETGAWHPSRPPLMANPFDVEAGTPR